MRKYIFLALLVILSSVLCAKHRTEVYVNGAINDAQKTAVQSNLTDAISELNRAFFAKAKPKLNTLAMDDGARTTITEMWDTKSFYCPEFLLVHNLLRRSDGLLEVRGIPIFYERKSSERFDDELVFILNPQGVITDIRIALDKEKYLRMFDQVNSLQDKVLYEIVLNFVENYRTAYNRKDINFIDRVFSNDALIIVGRVLSKGESLPDNLGLNKLSANKDVSYSRLNKDQYIRNLRTCFIKNRFVRLEFSDFKVQRHPMHEHVFGVQLHQKWRSSTYNDDGYLFLIINLRDLDEPQIWVRTWQPDKYITEKEAFELGDFIIE